MPTEPRTSKTTDEGAAHKYFAMIPHTITRGKRGRGLSLPARWLYVYLKSIAGEGGICNKSTSTIVKEAQLGRGTIPSAKEELIKAGLIKVVRREGKYHATDRVRLVDIWPENMQEFKGEGCSPPEQPAMSCSPDEQQGCSPSEQLADCSPDEQPLASCSPSEQPLSQEESSTSSLIEDKSSTDCSPHEQPSGCSPHELGCSPHEPKKNLLKKNPETQELNPPPLTPPQTGRVCVKDAHAIRHMEAGFTPYTAGFVAFCAVYPSTRIIGQQEAFSIWQLQGLEDRAPELIGKIEQLNAGEWRTKQRRYIPQLNTWFEKGRYNDPVATPDASTMGTQSPADWEAIAKRAEENHHATN